MKKLPLFAVVFMLVACPFTSLEEDIQKAVEETIAAHPPHRWMVSLSR